ncbi:redoxin domain-containing protein [Microbacterium sp. X-17]|uniref:redoxin domain-containing protein n=1 Tax=Microbacterium sp. X-17 TaxID=3144404 RepID=UPI0031F4A363
MSDEDGQRRPFRSLLHRRPDDDRDHLPDEGALAPFTRATAWLNSPPLTPAGLRGRVVLVDFWTFTCVNWLRTAPYLRAWHAKYASAGLTVIGVHTPEFGFEHDLPTVTDRVRQLGIEYPVAVDSDYGVWGDFDNHYWPALYVADADGRLRYHRFGEGEYAMTEMVLQELLRDAGADLDGSLIMPDARGLEVAADWPTLRSPETYLGYGQSSGFVSEDAGLYDLSSVYPGGARLTLNEWDLTGRWTQTRAAAVSGGADGRVSFAFHARDVNLVMGPAAGRGAVPFRVLLDGRPPGEAHGTDIDAAGNGVLDQQNTYQLIRQPGPIATRLVELVFPDGGAEAYCFTFG